jgi:hypothetical protein
MHQGGSIIVSLRVGMCRERVLTASVLYRLDCRDVYIHSLRRCRLPLIMAVNGASKLTAGTSARGLRHKGRACAPRSRESKDRCGTRDVLADWASREKGYNPVL